MFYVCRSSIMNTVSSGRAWNAMGRRLSHGILTKCNWLSLSNVEACVNKLPRSAPKSAVKTKAKNEKSAAKKDNGQWE